MEEKIFDQDFFNGLGRVKLVTRITMQGGRSGMRKSAAKGSSVEFADFREYVPGDDIRRIDWNTYGRMDKLFVKLFVEEREAYYSIITDTSASMDFGVPGKNVCAARLAGAVSYMALNNLDRVRLSAISGDKVINSSDFTGRQGFNKVMAWLSGMEFAGKTDLYKSIKRIPFNQRGVTVIISDLFSQNSTDENIENITDTIRYLRYMKQEVLVLHVLSPEEMKPGLEGTIGLEDAETGDILRVTATSHLCRQYKRVLDRFMSRAEECAKHYQAHYIPVCSNENVDTFIYKGIRSGQLENF
ncbi:MAG: DUF58 domain-containing protein [Lachnospiraceae bacterium]|nr:DUF58 domain-containing protein [Lachnospiraceae bacterium]